MSQSAFNTNDLCALVSPLAAQRLFAAWVLCAGLMRQAPKKSINWISTPVVLPTQPNPASTLAHHALSGVLSNDEGALIFAWQEKEKKMVVSNVGVEPTTSGLNETSLTR